MHTSTKYSVFGLSLVAALLFSVVTMGGSAYGEFYYSRFYGGDIFAGGGFLKPDGTCNVGSSPKASGYTLNDGAGGAGSFRGTGGELAVFAMDQVDGVHALSLQDSETPEKRTFANQIPVAVDVVNNQFGGDFLQPHCAYPYWDNQPSISGAFDLGNDPNVDFGDFPNSGAYRVGGSGLTTRFNTSLLPNGRRIVVYVEGNVNINGAGKLGYAATNWGNSRSAIPSFILVASGDIFIEGGITELDGIYIAEGDIHTCAGNGSGDNLAVPLKPGQIISDCGNKLTVFGSLIATKVHFLRYRNQVPSSVPLEPYTSPGISEAIIYSPEMFLTNGGELPRNGSVQIQSMNALPPVF